MFVLGINNVITLLAGLLLGVEAPAWFASACLECRERDQQHFELSHRPDCERSGLSPGSLMCRRKRKIKHCLGKSLQFSCKKSSHARTPSPRIKMCFQFLRII